MTRDSGSSGGSSSSSSSGSSEMKEYTKAKDTRGTGAAKDLADAVASLVSDNGSSASVSRDNPTGTNFGGARSLSSNTGGGGGGGLAYSAVPGLEGAPSDGGTSTAPRSDASVILAGQINRRPDRSPARSNNFVSLVSGAGSLGRRSSESKRTLIGGAA